MFTRYATCDGGSLLTLAYVNAYTNMLCSAARPMIFRSDCFDGLGLAISQLCFGDLFDVQSCLHIVSFRCFQVSSLHRSLGQSEWHDGVIF